MNPMYLRRSQVSLAATLVLSGCSGPFSVESAPPAPKIEVLQILPGPGTGCTLHYQMTNTYDFTMSIMGIAFLIDGSGNTIGSTFVRLPPALPGKTSETDAVFYDFQLADRSCGAAVSAKFRATVCDNVSAGEYFNDARCERIEATNNAN
jgi:hypothetical protein